MAKFASRHYQLLFKCEAQQHCSQWNWHQGVAEISYFQTIASNWNLLQTYKETTGRDSWSSLYDAPIYDSEKGKSYLILSPQETSEDSGSFRHIGLVDTTQVCSLNQNLRVRGGGAKEGRGGRGARPPKIWNNKNKYVYKHTIKVCVSCSWWCPGNSAPGVTNLTFVLVSL